jgi:hypothetical protein
MSQKSKSINVLSAADKTDPLRIKITRSGLGLGLGLAASRSDSERALEIAFKTDEKRNRVRSSSAPGGSLEGLNTIVPESEEQLSTKRPSKEDISSSLKKGSQYMSESQLWQNNFAPGIISSMSSKEKKKLSAIWELVKTEENYVRDLNILQDVA